MELLAQLQQCIGNLATHVYYADQISDMVSAILGRLKPSVLSSVPSAVAAVENPGAANVAITSVGNLTEDPNTDGFFSFATAKVSYFICYRNSQSRKLIWCLGKCTASHQGHSPGRK